MLFNIIFSFILLNCTYALYPSCNSCKWFIPYNNNDYGLCEFYKNTYPLLGTNITIYEKTTYCRNNEYMCGEKGKMYEPVNNKYKRRINISYIKNK